MCVCVCEHMVVVVVVVVVVASGLRRPGLWPTRTGAGPSRRGEATAGGALEEQTKIGRMLQEGGNGLSGAQQPQSLWSAAQQGAFRGSKSKISGTSGSRACTVSKKHSQNSVSGKCKSNCTIFQYLLCFNIVQKLTLTLY